MGRRLNFSWRSWAPLFQFELLYKLLSLTVFVPLAWALFNVSLRAAGLRYLDAANLKTFLFKPVTIMFLLLLLLLLAFYTLFDMSAVIYAMEQRRRGRLVSVPELLREGLSGSVRALARGPLLLAMYVVLVVPFINFGVTSGFLSALSVPEFIMNYIKARPPLYLAYLALAGALFCAAVKLIFSLHYCCLDSIPFPQAIRRSFQLTRGRFLKCCLLLIGWNLGTAAVFYAVSAGGTWLASVIYRRLSGGMVYTAVLSFVVFFMGILYLFWSCCSVPISFRFLSAIFYRFDGREAAKAPEDGDPRPSRVQRRFNIIYVLLLAVAFVLCGIYIHELAEGNVSLRIERIKDITVTAHRGYSSEYPENTMAAFRAAAEAGADCIELDVQQTADGVIVVMHDSSLKRTTGVNRPVWDMTWDEIRELDAGRLFGEEFAGEPVPSLDEVLAFADEAGVRLNIELKPTGHETDFEKSVIDIINAHDFAGRCVLTSLKYGVLERAKSYDPEIRTVYVMSVAYGDITRLEYADAFSVRYGFANRSLVSRVHQAGKTICVWTPNTSGTIQKMIDLDVDDIITDEPQLALRLIAHSRSGNLAVDLTHLLLGY